MNKSGINQIAMGLSLFCVLGGLSACSGDGDIELTPDEQAMLEADEQDFAMVEAALNNSSFCGNATPNKLFSSIISPSFTSPNTYAAGGNGCGYAYFTRVTDYREGNTNKTNAFTYAGVEPGNKAACEDTRLMVYVFDVTGSSATFIRSKQQYGVWTPPAGGVAGFCTLPVIYAENRCSDQPKTFNLITGRDYQFAVSARTNNSGTPVMQPIRESAPTQISQCTQ